MTEKRPESAGKDRGRSEAEVLRTIINYCRFSEETAGESSAPEAVGLARAYKDVADRLEDRHRDLSPAVPDGCYCDRSDHNKCPGGSLCCCSPELARELEAKAALETPLTPAAGRNESPATHEG